MKRFVEEMPAVIAKMFHKKGIKYSKISQNSINQIGDHKRISNHLNMGIETFWPH